MGPKSPVAQQRKGARSDRGRSRHIADNSCRSFVQKSKPSPAMNERKRGNQTLAFLATLPRGQRRAKFTVPRQFQARGWFAAMSNRLPLILFR